MRQLLSLAVLFALISGIATRAHGGDSFSFSVGSGHHHGHHHHHHGHGWSPYWGVSLWSPPPTRYVYVQPPVVQRVYVQQPPVVQERVIVEELPGPTANRLPSPATRMAANSSPVVIRNTNGQGASVAFLVDNRSEELRDGQTRTFAGTSSHIVEYDRGGNHGTARYELTGGLYGFIVGHNGWELVRDSQSSQPAERSVLKRNELPSDAKSR